MSYIQVYVSMSLPSNVEAPTPEQVTEAAAQIAELFPSDSDEVAITSSVNVQQYIPPPKIVVPADFTGHVGTPSDEYLAAHGPMEDLRPQSVIDADVGPTA